MQRRMNPIEVRSGEREGDVLLRQALGHPEDPDTIEISGDQIPILLAWLREAAGLAAEETSAPESRGEEIRRMAARFRAMEEAAGAHGGERSVIRGIRVALEWAAGDSKRAPDAWVLGEVPDES